MAVICHLSLLSDRRGRVPPAAGPVASISRAVAALNASHQERGPIHHADHDGDLIVVVDADLGVGVVGGAEGAQERYVPLEFGQGRAVSEGLRTWRAFRSS